jgi:hypothetical protein
MPANRIGNQGEEMSKLLDQTLATVNRPEMEPVQESVTPMGILQMAISQGADIDKLTKLMELKERWDATEARKAYVQAMADFKTEAIVITKDKTNKQYDPATGETWPKCGMDFGPSYRNQGRLHDYTCPRALWRYEVDDCSRRFFRC